MQPPEPGPVPPRPSSEWNSPLHVRALVLIGITGTAVYACFAMLAPFLAPLAWALALAVLFAPMHRFVASKLRWPNLAALVSVFAIVLAVVLPALLVGNRLLGEAAGAVELLRAVVDSGDWRRPFDALPATVPVGRWIEAHFDLPGLVQAAGSWLTTTATAVLRGSVVQVVSLLLTFYLLFYFLRDRVPLLRALCARSPLPAADMNRLFNEVFDTVHATVYGTLVVAAVQGLLGGLMFWCLGLPAALLWGVVMGLLAIVPVLGAFVVWLPATAFLLATGHEVRALLLLVWGAVVVGGIDNLLYPLLIGNRLKLHTAVALVSIVGGLLVFGAPGLILGPVIFTITRGLLDIWSRRSAEEEAA